MGQAVTITRTEWTASDIRTQAAKCEDADQARRLLAIAMILDGATRQDAACLTGMDRQTLRDWVHRYNEGSIDGLLSRKPPGAPARLSKAQQAQLYQWALDGPDPSVHKVIRWRCVDLCAEVARRFSVTIGERTMGK